MSYVNKIFFTLLVGTQTLPSPMSTWGLIPYSFLVILSPTSHVWAHLHPLKTQGNPSADLWGFLLLRTLPCKLRLPGVRRPALSPPPRGGTYLLETLPVLLLPLSQVPLSQVHCPMLIITKCVVTVVSHILSSCLT